MNAAVYMTLLAVVALGSCACGVWWLVRRFRARKMRTLVTVFLPLSLVGAYFATSTFAPWICGFSFFDAVPTTDFQYFCRGFLGPGFFIFFVSTIAAPLPAIVFGLALAAPIAALWIVVYRCLGFAHA